MVVLVHQYYNLSGYLSPPTREPPITGFQYLLLYHMLVLFVKTQRKIWTQDSEPAQIWTWISGTKSGYANHWATLHWQEVDCLEAFIEILMEKEIS